MGKISEKVELIANIAIIAIAIMIGAVLVKNYFSNSEEASPSRVPLGTKLSLPDVDWAKESKTLVLALQDGCHYCAESAPFYQRLVAETSARKIPLLVVLPHPLEQGQRYLDNLKIQISYIRQADFNSIGVRGTPTLLIVDSKGKVIDGWIGKLSVEKESEVLRRL